MELQDKLNVSAAAQTAEETGHGLSLLFFQTAALHDMLIMFVMLHFSCAFISRSISPLKSLRPRYCSTIKVLAGRPASRRPEAIQVYISFITISLRASLFSLSAGGFLHYSTLSTREYRKSCPHRFLLKMLIAKKYMLKYT
jgi:hypothetical protein